MEYDGFFIETLQRLTHYRDLLRKVPDEIFLDELAEDLTVSYDFFPPRFCDGVSLKATEAEGILAPTLHCFFQIEFA